jgi:hypothetical protein
VRRRRTPHAPVQVDSVTITKDFPAALKFLKLPPILAVMSVNPISGNQASQANEAAKPAAAPKPQQTQQASSAQPSDTVTLKSTGTSSQTGNNS